jgi:cyclophilin family peptidyl-prolyl cis-trans isomerase
MPRRKQIVQKQKRRKVYQAGELDVRAVKPKGAFRIFTNYRLFAIIGAIVLIGGFGLSALFAKTNSSSTSQKGTVRGADVQRTTPEAGSTDTTPGNAKANIKQYGAAPALAIDPNKTYTATIKTDAGDVKIQLLPKDAPGAVNNFVFLARDGYYDGVTFFRVIPGFVAQAGDPTGTGSGGPGYDLPFENTTAPVDAGSLAMAKPPEAGAPNNGSQFFLALDRLPTQDGKATVFGKVVSGLDVATKFVARNPLLDQNPAVPTRIQSITIDES